ncbi:LemA family protein [Wohlfahrtiimonas larvae]|uniref:LemA family protein n=1 Tax=Wohlfahrtiimonas larvae TaxID=1157986 RepID=A0ABP9MSV0_9GAMM|nr:LemA family protein [Wohlfahrtiimonas larvae]
MTASTLMTIISVIIAMIVITIFNRLVRKRNYCRNSFAQIDVQLKKRHDLVPNLVSVAQGYLKHEAVVLEKVISARQQASESLMASRDDIGALAKMQILMQSESSFASALQGFFANVEAYPELKANQQMKLLHEELIHIENTIAFARQAYNDSVTFYNIDRESFPSNIIAGLLGFKHLVQLDLEINSGVPKVFQ